MSEKLSILKNLQIGGRVAEDETDELERYFVETDQWQQMYDGSIDIVYGAKGTGKSAIYSLLNRRSSQLFDKNVLLASAENLRGATVFRGLITDPPPSELSFIFLWKLYCLTIIAKTFREYGVNNEYTSALISSLERAKLLPANATITTLFRAVQSYFKGWINRDVSAVEYGLSIDPTSGMPIATRKTEFRENSEQQNLEEIPIEELLEVADKALEKASFKIWILFDRLDVAFAESKELERNALRALFRTYNDMRVLNHISLKIFVRDDIWKRISSGGFAEASHITKTSHISWSDAGLLNLIIRRLLNNPTFVSYLSVTPDEVVSDFQKQQQIMLAVLPDKIDTGKNPATFDWMISRTKDGLGVTAPRELIHLFESIKDIQIKKLERGEPDPEDKLLFDRVVFKDALDTVSKVRYDQTLVAEYPEFKAYMDKLDGKKAEHNTEALAELWAVTAENAGRIADGLVSVGFFEKRGENNTSSYWVPFLYRGALDLVQGKSF